MIRFLTMPLPGHTLSIVCVSLNEEAHLPLLKQAIDDLDRPDGQGIETLLVDGGSRDATRGAAAHLKFDQIVDLPGANIPTCRNHGVRRASGEWIAFLDADCAPARDWLTRAAPWLAGPCPTLVGWPTHPPSPGTWVQRAWHVHWTHKNNALTECEGQRVILHQAFRLVTTRNLLMNRQVFDQLNGFDEHLDTGEDTDFALRAQHHGIRVVASPALRVRHNGEPDTVKAFFQQQRWHANRNSYRKSRSFPTGHHAPYFTIAYLGTLSFAMFSLLASALLPAAWPLLGLLPFATILVGPATLIAWRAKRLRYIPALTTLYAVYGLARSIDWLGGHPKKPSWKSPA